MSRFIQEEVKKIYRHRAKWYFWSHLLTTVGHCQFKWRPLLAKLALADLPKVTERYRILDLCTGWGLSMAAIWKEYQKNFSCYPQPLLIGLDMSSEMITIGRKHWLVKARERELHYTVALAQNIPFPNNHFHAVTMMCGMGGIPCEIQGEVFREILRVLKPSGKIFLLDVTKTPKETLSQKLTYWLLKPINRYITEPYVLRFWGWESIEGLVGRIIQSIAYDGYGLNLLRAKNYSELFYPFAHVQIIEAEKVPK